MPLALVPRFELLVTFAVIDPESVIITRQKTYEIVGADFDAAQVNRDAFLADLVLATGAQIIEHRLTERYVSGDAITSTFNLYREMLITFILSDGIKKAAHSVPAPSLNFVAGQSLNLGHADVTAYINNFLLTGGVVTISDGEKVRDANNVAASRVRQVASGKSYT